MKRFAPLFLAFALTACAGATPDPQIVTKTVEVPVAVKCQVDIGPEPAYPDTDAALKAASGPFERVKLLVAGRLMRIARDVTKTEALAGCTGQ